MGAHAQARTRSTNAEATTSRLTPPFQRRWQTGQVPRELVWRLGHSGEVARPAIPPIVRKVLEAPGQVLDPLTRAFMGARFNRDFSAVRVHADASAADSARAIEARAFAVGNDIVFGAGEYAPRTPSGRWVLAHELAHVQQQRDASAVDELAIGAPASGPEAEANRAAQAVAGGTAGPWRVGIATRAAANIIHRLSLGGGIGIALGALAGAAAIAGLVAGLVSRGRRLMHWETNAPDVPMVDDPSSTPPTSTIILPANTRVVIVDDGAGQPFNAHNEQWVKVRVTVGPFLNRVGWLHRSQLESRPETEEIEPEQANEIFTALAHANIMTNEGEASIPFHYPPDGCYARAHRMEELLTEMGYASEKVFALAGRRPLVVETQYAPDQPGDKVVWAWHVAPIIKVRDPQRGAVETVIDPSLYDRPITLTEWEGLMGDARTYTRLSLSQVREEMRTDPSLRQHERVAVTAPRYTYRPSDLQRDETHQEAESEDVAERSRMTGYVHEVPVFELARQIRRELAQAVVKVMAILAAIRAAAHNVRQAFKQQFQRLLAQLHQRLQPDAAAQVDAALDE
ncbi:MAG TPA: DUF4157 domain-containing protein [Acetobacteraceae bacterium]|nr:DUF4157 domain-containing protein [Acetobacteraceae bacterium]